MKLFHLKEIRQLDLSDCYEDDIEYEMENNQVANMTSQSDKVVNRSSGSDKYEEGSIDDSVEESLDTPVVSPRFNSFVDKDRFIDKDIKRPKLIFSTYHL